MLIAEFSFTEGTFFSSSGSNQLSLMQINDSVTIYFIYNSTVWLEKWAKRNLMKCKVLHLSRNNPRHKCMLGDTSLSSD